jgi:hypothetical protein
MGQIRGPIEIKAGATNQTRYVTLRGATDFAPQTGYAATAIDLVYTRIGELPAAKVDATGLSAADDAHADNTAFEVDSSGQPGMYRIDWPDAPFATGSAGVFLCVKGTAIDPYFEEVSLTNHNPRTYIDTSGRVDVGSWLGTAVTLATGSGLPKTDTWSINGSTEAALNLQTASETIVLGTVDNTAFTPTATAFETNITEATADHFIGRIITFTSGADQDQSTDITDYELSGGRGKFTVTALTAAPANGDTFLIT